MKKLFVSAFFVLAFAFFFPSTASADLIPPDSHFIKRCVKIVNLDKFPDIVLINNITGPMVQDNEKISQVNGNECLSKGYKFNELKIYWNSKDKADTIDPSKLLLENTEVDGGYIEKNNPLENEAIEYSLDRSSDGKMIMYKSKQISEYNNGTPKKVETFTSPLNKDGANKDISIPQPEPAKRGFWQSVVCFFRSLFGKGCQ